MPPKPKEKKAKKVKRSTVGREEWRGGLSRKLAKNPPKFMNRGYLTEEQLNSFIDDATDYPDLFRKELEETLLDWTDAEKAKWTQFQLLATISNIAMDFEEDEDLDQLRKEYKGKKGGRSRETSAKRFPVSADRFRKIGGKSSVKIIGAKQLATRATKKEVIAEEGATYDYDPLGAVATHMNIGYDSNIVVKLGDQREMTQQPHIEDATDAPYPRFDNRWAEEAEEVETVGATGGGSARIKYTGGEFRDYPREGKAKYTAHNIMLNPNYAIGKDSVPIKYTKGAYVDTTGIGDLFASTTTAGYYTPPTGNHMWGGQNPKRQPQIHMKQEVYEGMNYKKYRVPVKGEKREKYEGGEGIHRYRGFAGKEVIIRGKEDLEKLNLTQLKHIAKVQGIPVEDIEMDTGGVGGGGNKRLVTTGVRTAQGRYKGLPHKYSKSMEVWEENPKTGEWGMKKRIIKSGQLDKFTKEGGQRRQYRTTELDREDIIDMILKGGQKPLKKYVVPKGWVEDAIDQNLEDEGAEYGGALGEAVIANEMEEETGDTEVAEQGDDAPPQIEELAEEELLDIQGDDSDEEFDPIDDSEVINDVILDNHDPNKIIAHEIDIDHLIGATGIIRDAIETREYNLENKVALEQRTYKKRRAIGASRSLGRTPRALESRLAIIEDRPSYDKPALEDTRTNYKLKKPLMVGKKSSVNPSIWSQQMNDGRILLQDSYSGFHIPERISGQQIKQYQDKSYIGGANIKRDTQIKKPIDTGSISTAPLPRYDWMRSTAQPKQATFKGTKYNMSAEGVKRTTEYSDYMSATTLLKRPEHIFYDDPFYTPDIEDLE